MLGILVAHAIAAIAAPYITRRIGRRVFYVLAAVPAASLIWVLAHWPSSDRVATEDYSWIPSLQLNLELRLNTLEAGMSVLVLGIGALVLLYCSRYFGTSEKRLRMFPAEMVAFAGVMFGLVTSNNLLMLFIFWELTTVLSFLLVGFYATRATARRAATQALLVTTFGGLSMLVGIIMLGVRYHTMLITEIVHRQLDAGHPDVYVQVAITLVLVGALSKSAIVPMHFWLPGAMAAPTPVSAYLHAAAMVKAGVFLVATLAPAFARTGSWQWMVIGLGLFSMIIAGWRSLREFDLKLILAFGTVSQLGFLMVLFGFGERDITLAGMTMLLAHALFKATLFMVVGIIDHSTGTRDIRRLSRLGRTTPALTVIAIIAAASMAGIPPLLGFVGKESAFDTVLHAQSVPHVAAWLIVVGLVVGSVLTFAYSCRFIYGAFADKGRSTASAAVADMHRPGVLFCLSPAILSVLTIIGGVFSGYLNQVFDPYLEGLPVVGHFHVGLWHGVGLPLVLSAVVIIGGAVLALSHRWLATHRPTRPLLGNAEKIYDSILATADVISLRLTRGTQRGSLPINQGVILLTFVIVPLTVLFLGGRNQVDVRWFDSRVEFFIGVLLALSAIGVCVLRNRLSAVLVTGVTGYACAAIYAVHGAPDLALTQVLVETLTLVIFVLVLRKFSPSLSPNQVTTGRWLRAGIGIAVGAAIALLGAFAIAARTTTPVHSVLEKAAYQYGHGMNTVNVILVDTRAWDTMGEISVLLVTATGVASLVFRNRRFGAAPRIADAVRSATLLGKINLPAFEHAAASEVRGTQWLSASYLRDPRHRSLLLEVSTRILFPSIMVLSIYFFFSGHNAPGGGFAGGLTAGLALTLRYLAGGRYELGETLPMDAGRILGLGLLFSAGTACASMLAGAPPLSSAVWDLHLPLFGDIHIVSALFFDLGVYLIVVGLVLDVLRSLGARLDAEIALAERDLSAAELSRLRKISHAEGRS